MEYKDATDIIAGAHNLLSRLEARIRKSWVHRVFWHSVNVRWYTPPIWGARAWEVDEPFRGGRTVLLRYWRGKSLVLGFWGKTSYDEAEALLNATIHGRERTHGERSGWDDQSYESAEFDGTSGTVLTRRPGLRVGASVDAGADGQ